MRHPDNWLVGVVYFFRFMKSPIRANEWLRAYRREYAEQASEE